MKQLFAVFVVIAILAETGSVNVPVCVQATLNTFALVKRGFNGNLGCPKGHCVCQQGIGDYRCESCGNYGYQPDFNYPGDYCFRRKICNPKYNWEYAFMGNTTHDAICRCKVGYKNKANDVVCTFDVCPHLTELDGQGNCVAGHRKRNPPTTTDKVPIVITYTSHKETTGRDEPTFAINAPLTGKSMTSLVKRGENYISKVMEVMLPISVVIIAILIFLPAFVWYKICNKKNEHNQTFPKYQCLILRPSAGRRVVTRNEASNIGENLGASWILLAHRLNYSSSAIDRFRLTNQFDTSIQSVTMLQRWLEKEGDHATVEVLAKELRQLQDIDHRIVRDTFHDYYVEMGYV